ncbi:MAG: UrcA family protein [Sphingomonadaceae bacterium]
MKRPLTALAAACTTIAIAAPALADTRSIAVEYKDLNLSSPEGQKKLAQRINRAARQVCQVDQLATGTRIRAGAALQCYKTASAKAQNHMARVIENNRYGG